MKYLAISFAIIAVYFLAGLVGLEFTLTGSNSSIIWPPAGIALAALICKGPRYAPAVFAGAFLTNFIHFGSSDLAGMLSVLPSALGAMVQALVGYALIARFVRLPTMLRNIKDPLLVVLLGGIIACLINALFANAAFSGFVITDPIAFAQNSFAWWAGDVLGVMIMTPLLMLICTKVVDPRMHKVSAARKVTVASVMVLMFCVVMYLFHVLNSYEYNERQARFIRTSYDISESLQHQLNIAIKALEMNERYFATSEQVNANDFRAFNDGVLTEDSGIYGLAWIPKVTRDEREEFEFALRAQGYKDFTIKQRHNIGDMDVADDHDVYFPIAYTIPYSRNEKAHGFDVYADDPVVGYSRRQLLDFARDNGKVIATPMFPIVQAESQYGFILYYPVYRDNYRRQNDTMRIEERRERLIGFINGIFVFPYFMQPIRQNAATYGVDIALYEVHVSESRERLLYDSRTANHMEPTEAFSLKDGQYKASEIFHVAGQVWRLDMFSTVGYGQGQSWILWAVVVFSLLFTGFICLFMILITARTEIVEAMVRKKTDELLNAKQFQDLIMYHNPDLVFVKNQALEIVQANHAFLEAYPEYQREHVIGRSSKEGYSKRDYDEFLAEDMKAFAEGASEKIETITFPDGRKRTLLTRKIRFEDSKGEPFLLGLSRDVTERETLIAKLTDTNVELEEFAYRTSHDLRAPLVSSSKLLSMADIALDNDQIDHARKCINHAETSIKKLEALINDILQLTQAKNGEEEVEDINLKILVTNALDKISNIDGYERIKIIQDIDVNQTISVCKSRLTLIVENLLSNAVKYADPQEEQPIIRISAHFSRKNLVFKVEDNGLGIPPEHQAQLFSMFKRFHPKVSFGSGLGLYMMKKSADILGGEIHFEPPAKGACFVLKIPLHGKTQDAA